MEIADIANGQNKKLVYWHVNENWFFILVVNHVSKFPSKK